MEEVGELATALMEERWQNVEAEAVQVAVMAQRLATECQYLRGTFGEADNK